MDTDEKREAEVAAILAKLKAEEKTLLDFAFAHDTSRVVQSCLQHGSHAQRVSFLKKSLNSEKSRNF